MRLRSSWGTRGVERPDTPGITTAGRDRVPTRSPEIRQQRVSASAQLSRSSPAGRPRPSGRAMQGRHPVAQDARAATGAGLAGGVDHPCPVAARRLHESRRSCGRFGARSPARLLAPPGSRRCSQPSVRHRTHGSVEPAATSPGARGASVPWRRSARQLGRGAACAAWARARVGSLVGGQGVRSGTVGERVEHRRDPV